MSSPHTPTTRSEHGEQPACSEDDAFLYEAMSAAIAETFEGPQRALLLVNTSVIFHGFPQYADETAFLFWFANIKPNAPLLPAPIKIRFTYSNGIAFGKYANYIKGVELRFRTESEAKKVVNYFMGHSIQPCWCAVDHHSLTCPDGHNIKICCHHGSNQDDDYRAMKMQPGMRKWTLSSVKDSRKPPKGWYHIANEEYQDDDDDEGCICEWYHQKIGVWISGDCNENHDDAEFLGSSLRIAGMWP